MVELCKTKAQDFIDAWKEWQKVSPRVFLDTQPAKSEIDSAQNCTRRPVRFAGHVVHHEELAHAMAPHRLQARERLPGDDEDEQARYIEALVELPSRDGAKRQVLRLASIYLPNGNPVGTEKFAYKLAWMDRLHAHVQRG